MKLQFVEFFLDHDLESLKYFEVQKSDLEAEKSARRSIAKAILEHSVPFTTFCGVCGNQWSVDVSINCEFLFICLFIGCGFNGCSIFET